MHWPNTGGDHGEKIMGFGITKLGERSRELISWIRAFFKASLPSISVPGPVLQELKSNNQNQ